MDGLTWAPPGRCYDPSPCSVPGNSPIPAADHYLIHFDQAVMRRRRWPSRSGAPAVAVAWSRVRTGAHHPGDVAGATVVWGEPDETMGAIMAHQTAHQTGGKEKAPTGAKGQMGRKDYERELAKLQIDLVKLQEWIRHEGLKVAVLFEGRDAAGKGGTIKRITESLNPRICRVVALGTPTERERTQWYFQRYAAQLPAAGEMVLFDRSWYNRAGVEHVMGFCTDDEYHEFLRSAPEFEKMLIRSGIVLIKYWFSVSDDEQERRFRDRIQDRTKRWKLSPMDLESRKRWFDYSRAKDAMFLYTDIPESPW